MNPASAKSPQAVPRASALTPDEVRKMNAYWRAANYLSVGQIYLFDNPLLREPLKPEHVKPACWAIGALRRDSISFTFTSTG
jgi:xylulose-5-phosphate/fructose-6-phosphate phosphoketolase